MPFYEESGLSHYSLLASKDSEYSREAEPQVLAVILRLLSLSPRHHLVDLGAGACRLAAALHRAGGLLAAALCVDPSQEMLSQGAGLQGVVTACQTGLAWVRQQEAGSVDRVLIRQAVHHVTRENLKEFFSALHLVLAPGGRVCITKRGDLEDIFPWPPGFYESMAGQEPDMQELRSIMEVAGFQKFTFESLESKKMERKEDIFSRFRSRFLSWLSHLTDQEIETGLQEMVRRQPGDLLPVVVRELFLLAEK